MSGEVQHEITLKEPKNQLDQLRVIKVFIPHDQDKVARITDQRYVQFDLESGGKIRALSNRTMQEGEYSEYREMAVNLYTSDYKSIFEKEGKIITESGEQNRDATEEEKDLFQLCRDKYLRGPDHSLQELLKVKVRRVKVTLIA